MFSTCIVAAHGLTSAELPIHSVSGHSSGGDMAVLHFVAFSSRVTGAGVNAGAPYGCNLLNQPETTCGTPGPWENWNQNDRKMDNYLVQRANSGKVDPLSAMMGRKVLLFSGSADTVVYPSVMRAVYRQLAPHVGASNVMSVFNIPAQHAWVTADRSDHICGYLGSPFINYCNYGLSGKVLAHVLDETLSSPTRATTANLKKLAQKPYLPSGTSTAKARLADDALLYVPTACTGTPLAVEEGADGVNVHGGNKTASCRLHVFYHGCRQTGLNSHTYVMKLGLHQWAESNRIVVLHPQAAWGTHNPDGCWDWLGRTGADFDTTDGLQLATVGNMLKHLSKGLATGGLAAMLQATAR